MSKYYLLEEIPDAQTSTDGQSDEITRIELVIYQILFGISFSFVEHEMKRNNGIRVWQKSVDDRTQDVSQRQNTQEKEISGQQEVYVLFGEELLIGIMSWAFNRGRLTLKKT